MQTTEVLNEIKQHLLEENSININGKIYHKDNGYVPSEAYLKRLEQYKAPFDNITVFETIRLKNEALSIYDNTINKAKQLLKLIYGWGIQFTDAVAMDLKRRIQLIKSQINVSIHQMIDELKYHLGWDFYTVSTTGNIIEPESIFKAWKMMGNSRMRDLKDVLFQRN